MLSKSQLYYIIIIILLLLSLLQTICITKKKLEHYQGEKINTITESDNNNSNVYFIADQQNTTDNYSDFFKNTNASKGLTQMNKCITNTTFKKCNDTCKDDKNCSGFEWNPLLKQNNIITKNVCCHLDDKSLKTLKLRDADNNGILFIKKY